MSDESGIRKFLDAGSLDLYARQITERFDDVLSVAVYDNLGRRAWPAGAQDDDALWSDRLVRNPFAAESRCVELENGRSAYEFPLRQSRVDEPVGYLLIQTRGERRLDASAAHTAAEPILECIRKQLDINIELTAGRRHTARDRRNAELLVRLDDLRKEPDSRAALETGLRMTAAHCGALLVVLWRETPDLRVGLQPGGRIAGEELAVSAPIFSRLISAARRRRQVVTADVPAALRKIAGCAKRGSQLLATPILDEHDNVAGVLTLVAGSVFRREDVRLTRAIASKLAVLEGEQPRAPQSTSNRHDLLARIDADLEANDLRSRALLLVDIDRLHVINEMHGHFGGDAAIRAVLAEARRSAGTDGVACDLQGGVIALYLPDCNEDDARHHAIGLQEALAASNVQHDGRPLEIRASIGIAMVPNAVSDAASALNTAEVAARSAKARGGNQFVVFDDLDASVLRRREDLDQVGMLQAALLENRFELYAQPIVPLQVDDSRPRFEILLRMVDEQGAMLSPERFLSAAERYQMMTSIDRWVVRTATDMLSNSDNQLEVNLASFSINVSPQSMMDEEFPNFVEKCITDSGISPDTFCFEITESAVMRNVERAQELLRRLRRLGCRLALDDFGTGQCSFARLKDMPVQYIKIDGVFIRDIVDNPLSAAIVESVARIARVVHARTVAEFVENDLILGHLKRAGIDYAQGYRVGKPVPLASVLDAFNDPVPVTDDLDAISG